MASHVWNDPCPCKSGKLYRACCSGKDLFVATYPADDADQAIGKRGQQDGPAYRAKRDLAEEYFRERVEDRGPIAMMMDFVKPFLSEMDDSPASIRKVMDIGLISWNIALRFDPGEEEEIEIAATSVELFPEDLDDRMRFAEIARWMIARHRQRYPELHAEAARQRGVPRTTRQAD